MDAVRLLLTSDTHGGMDFPWGRETLLPRLATAIARARRAAGPGVTLDNGDVFFGTGFANFAAALPAAKNPIAASFARIGFDAVNLGNEDLRHGAAACGELGRTHRLPLLSSNLMSGEGSIAPSRILSLSLGSGSLTVGVLGVVAPSACRMSPAANLRPPAQRLAEGVAFLRGQGCDLIVALCHTGVGPRPGVPADQSECVALAAIPGIDVAVAGHLHELTALLPDRSPAALVIAPGSFARHLGIIDLTIKRSPAGRPKFQLARLGLHAVSHEKPCGDVARLLEPHLATFRACSEEVVGRIDDDLSTEYAPMVKPSFVRWMEDCLRRHIETITARTDAVVVTQCAGGRGPLPWTLVRRGAVTAAELEALFPYANELVLAEVSGETLVAWIIESCRIFCPAASVAARSIALQPILDERVAFCDHDFFSEVDFVIDVDGGGASATPRDIRWRGETIHQQRRFSVALSSYRYARLAGGGGDVTHPRSVAPCIRSLLRARLAVSGEIPAPAPRRFAPVHPHAVLYLRAKRAAATRPPAGMRWVNRSRMGMDAAAVYTVDVSGDAQ